MNLDNEIKVLQLFGYALREENGKSFEQMMAELDSMLLEAASVAKDPFELVALALIFQLQKMISELMKRLKK